MSMDATVRVMLPSGYLERQQLWTESFKTLCHHNV